MSNSSMISLKKASSRFNVPEYVLMQWIKDRKITSSDCSTEDKKIIFIEKKSLQKYIDRHILRETCSDYFTEVLEDLTAEVCRFPDYQDRLANLKHLLELYPFFEMVVFQISHVIPNKVKKEIFVSVITNKKTVLEVAKEYNMSVDKIHYYIECSIKKIKNSEPEFIEYEKRNEELRKEIYKLRFMLEAERKSKNQLLQVNNLINIESYVIPENILDIFSIDVCRLFHEEIRIVNTFLALDIYTIGDLLGFCKHGGLNILLRIRNFGKKSYTIVRNKLIEMEILDNDDNSPYYKFIPDTENSMSSDR